MNAEPLLNKVAKVFAKHRLEAIMVGNAAAALHGALVTTLDIDFMFRKTPLNLKKFKAVAQSFKLSFSNHTIRYPTSYGLLTTKMDFAARFISRLHGIRSFEGLRSRSTTVEFG